MTSEAIRKLTAYFQHFDGTAQDWDTKVRPAVEDLYHPQLKIYSTTAADDGKDDDDENSPAVVVENRDEMIAFVKKFSDAGGQADMEPYQETPDGDVLYAGRLHTPDGLDVKIHSLGTFQDGKLISIQPADPMVYKTMMSREYQTK
jgi:hypothetical protein